jgi:riboflavin synthase
MFTGIVKEIGTVAAFDRGEEGARIRISAGVAGDLATGDSISVSGACLTAAAVDDGAFEADVMNQTLGLTTLGALEAGSGVNLEAALRAGEPLGGHIVQGHVDCVGEVTAARRDGFAKRLAVSLPVEHRRFAVEHGSITVDGVSLTVAALTDDGIEVSLIPETLERTTLGALAEGGRVNVELDVIARYVDRLLRFRTEGTPHA